MSLKNLLKTERERILKNLKPSKVPQIYFRKPLKVLEKILNILKSVFDLFLKIRRQYFFSKSESFQKFLNILYFLYIKKLKKKNLKKILQKYLKKNWKKSSKNIWKKFGRFLKLFKNLWKSNEGPKNFIFI